VEPSTAVELPPTRKLSFKFGAATSVGTESALAQPQPAVVRPSGPVPPKSVVWSTVMDRQPGESPVEYVARLDDVENRIRAAKERVEMKKMGLDPDKKSGWADYYMTRPQQAGETDEEYGERVRNVPEPHPSTVYGRKTHDESFDLTPEEKLQLEFVNKFNKRMADHGLLHKYHAMDVLRDMRQYGLDPNDDADSDLYLELLASRKPEEWSGGFWDRVRDMVEYYKTNLKNPKDEL
jgi:hypothetical protein